MADTEVPVAQRGMFALGRDILTRKHWLSPYLVACFFLVEEEEAEKKSLVC